MDGELGAAPRDVRFELFRCARTNRLDRRALLSFLALRMYDVARDPSASGSLIWRFPKEIRSGMPLLCFGNDTAVLLRGGQVVNTMRPGTYVLTSAMLGPGAKPGAPGTPLDCTVLFVSSQAHGGWPVSGPVPVRDPQGAVRASVRFAGTFGLRCSDVKRLVATVSGALGPLEVRLAEIMRTPVLSALQSALAATTLGNPRAILGLREGSGARDVLEAALMPGRQELAAYGLAFLGFDGGTFTLTPDDETHLSRQLAPAPAAATAPSSVVASSAPSSPAQPRPFAQTPYPITRENPIVQVPPQASLTPVPQRPAFAITPVPITREPMPAWPEGTRVLALWSDGRWYPGVVRERRGDQHEIAFENSTATRWVGPGEIQSI